MNIIACVVTYNRKELLAENIKETLAQTYPVSKMVVVDNHSTDGTKAFLQNNGILNDPRIVYKELRENIGGAGGFFTATKCAYELGADAIWLMDDDGHPASKDALKNLVDYSEKSGGGILFKFPCYLQ